MRICPKTECSEPQVHGHGGDESFLSRESLPEQDAADTRGQKWRAGAIQEAAERASAASVHVLGTKGALSAEKAEEYIRWCLEAAFYSGGEYDDQDWFIGGPLVVNVQRRSGPWPTFSVYVRADEDRFYPPQDPA